MSGKAHHLITICFLVAAIAGCKKGENDRRDEDKTSGTVPAQTTRTDPTPHQDHETPGSPNIADAEIAAIASTAHMVEIDAAKLALSKTNNPQVKAFAEMMITDHGKALEDGKALVAKLDMAPQENEISKQMKDEAQAARSKLEAMNGADFDKAYVAAQVKDHQKVLDTLDSKLIPSADNADLKTLLTSVRPVVAAHLEHAKTLESGMK